MKNCISKKKLLLVFIVLFSIGCLSACGTKEKVIEKDENGKYKSLEDFYAAGMEKDKLEKSLSQGMLDMFEKTAIEADENEVYLKFYLKKDSSFLDDDYNYIKLVGAIYSYYLVPLKFKDVSMDAGNQMKIHIVVYDLDDVIRYSCKIKKGTTKAELRTELSEYYD